MTTTVHLACLLPQCGWEPARGSPPKKQLVAYRAHWAAQHPHPRSRAEMASRAEIKKMTELLDSYIGKAMNWPKLGDESGPFDNDGLAAETEDRVAKAAATAAGRGVAEVMAICGQEGLPGPEDVDGKNATAIIRLAVARFRNGGVDPEIPKPEPVAEEPVAEEPVAEEPVAEEPVAEEPVADGAEVVAALPARGVAHEHLAADGTLTPGQFPVDAAAVAEVPGVIVAHTAEAEVDPEPVADQPAAPVEPHVLRESYESWVNTPMRPGAGVHVQAGGDPCPTCGGRGYTYAADPADSSGIDLGFSTPCATCGRLGYIAALPDPATQYVELDPEHIASIRMALDGGFDAPTLAAQFKIPLEQVESLR